MKCKCFFLLILLLLLAACGNKQSATSEYEDSSNRYVTETIYEDMYSGSAFTGLVTEDFVLVTTANNILTKVDTEGDSTPFLDTKEAVIEGLCVTPDNHVAVFCRSYESEDAASFCLEVTPEGDVLRKTIIEAPEEMNWKKTIIDKEHRIWTMYLNNIYVFETSGEALKVIELDTMQNRLILDNDNRILAAQASQENCCISHVDLESGQLTEICELNYFGNESFVQLFADSRGREYFADDNYLYRFLPEKKEIMPVWNWMELGIRETDVESFGAPGVKDEYVVVIKERNGTSFEIQRIVSAGGKAEKEKLVLACCGVDASLMEYVCSYNKSNDAYNVFIKNYELEDDPYGALNLDIISGQSFDLIDLSALSAEEYGRRGILEDLSGYFDSNEFVDSYVKAIQSDGKIYGISPTFFLYSLLGDQSGVGDKPGWSTEKFMAFLRDNREAVTVSYVDKNDLLRLILSTGVKDFMVEKDGKPCLNEEAVSNVLRFVNEYTGISAADFYQQGYSMFDLARNNPSFVIETTLMNVNDFRVYNHVYSERLVGKGYPSEKGDGIYLDCSVSFGIGAASKQKEAAWEFIEYFLMAETQRQMLDSGFPTRKDVLQELMDGKIAGYDKKSRLQVTVNGKEEEIGGFTAEEAAKLSQLIYMADEKMPDNTESFRIIQEEAQGFFQGQKSLEHVVGIISNRLNLLALE